MTALKIKQDPMLSYIKSNLIVLIDEIQQVKKHKKTKVFPMKGMILIKIKNYPCLPQGGSISP